MVTPGGYTRWLHEVVTEPRPSAGGREGTREEAHLAFFGCLLEAVADGVCILVVIDGTREEALCGVLTQVESWIQLYGARAVA